MSLYPTPPSDLDVTGDLSGANLKKDDLAAGAQRFTVTAVARAFFEARDGRPAANKIVLTFAGEPARKLVLNKTNLRVMADTFGARTSAWLGKPIVVYVDPTVTIGADRVGGLRIYIEPVPVMVTSPAMPVTAPVTRPPVMATVPPQGDDIDQAMPTLHESEVC